MEFPHELSVNIILDHKGQAAVKDEGILAQYAFVVAKVEDEQVGAARIKGMEFIAFKGSHQVVVDNRVFADRIDTDLVKRHILEVYAVAAAEYLGMFSTLQYLLTSRPPSGPVGRPDSLKMVDGLTPTARKMMSAS